MKVTLKRLMFWVVMAAIIAYMSCGPMPENKFQNYAVAATLTLVIYLAAKRRPLGFLVLGVILLKCYPFMFWLEGEDVYGVSFWGASGACFVGALAGWDERWFRDDLQGPGEPAE